MRETKWKRKDLHLDFEFNISHILPLRYMSIHASFNNNCFFSFKNLKTCTLHGDIYLSLWWVEYIVVSLYHVSILGAFRQIFSGLTEVRLWGRLLTLLSLGYWLQNEMLFYRLSSWWCIFQIWISFWGHMQNKGLQKYPCLGVVLVLRMEINVIIFYVNLLNQVGDEGSLQVSVSTTYV